VKVLDVRKNMLYGSVRALPFWDGSGTDGRENFMQRTFLIESRSYDNMLRGSWLAYELDPETRLSDETLPVLANECIRLWLPAGTLMRWVTQTRPLQYNCVQYFWPERWYMLSAFYDGLMLRHTYASVIMPPKIEPGRLSFVDLDLTLLVKPDLSYEVLTQAEFDQMADLLGYSEETRISALMALRTLTNSVQLGLGLFSTIPRHLRSSEFHLSRCS